MKEVKKSRSDYVWCWISHKDAPLWVKSYERRYRKRGGTNFVWGKKIILTGKHFQYKLQFKQPPRGWDSHGQCSLPVVKCAIYKREIYPDASKHKFKLWLWKHF